jgi:hypothetical protein
MTQLTLDNLIELLQNFKNDDFQKFQNPHSYRRFYDELAIEMGNGTMKGHKLISMLESCDGRTFEGYKGGSFEMHFKTPLWVADKGCTGAKIMGVQFRKTLTMFRDKNRANMLMPRVEAEYGLMTGDYEDLT